MTERRHVDTGGDGAHDRRPRSDARRHGHPQPHLDRVGERYVEGPPDLVVEVSSPSTHRLDLLRKRRLYERFGVPEYWFVDLDADRIEAYRLADHRYGAPTVYEHDDVAAASVLDGFSVAVAALLVG